MAKNSNAQSAGNNNGLIKALLAVVTVAVIAALALSFMSFSTANQNQSELKAVTAAIAKQTEVLADMQGQASPEELTKIIRNEMDAARRDDLLKSYKNLVGDWNNAKPQIDNSDDANLYGAEEAEVSVIEFSDFDCPYCQRFHETPKQVVDQSGGQVNWVWKHFPVHPSARPLHEATQCIAKQDNRLFWVATQLVFDEGGSRGIKPEKLGEMLPIDQEAYLNCLGSSEIAQSVQEDYNFGQEAGVTGTPATFVIHNRTNQVMQLKGAVPASQVKAAVQQLIQAAAQGSEQG
ncbi:DsbA family protein [Marinobacter salicampi]|uniref:DsbA family protein n=1 Tax=Marinobacter salicampi TaxID=435907 RepID=UPI00140BDEB9|nr:DsbA family protein [Marinobacter salicampi]